MPFPTVTRQIIALILALSSFLYTSVHILYEFTLQNSYPLWYDAVTTGKHRNFDVTTKGTSNPTLIWLPRLSERKFFSTYAYMVLRPQTWNTVGLFYFILISYIKNGESGRT